MRIYRVFAILALCFATAWSPAHADVHSPCNLLLTSEYQPLFEGNRVRTENRIDESRSLIVRDTNAGSEVIIFDFKTKKTKVLATFSQVYDLQSDPQNLVTLTPTDEGETLVTIFSLKDLKKKTLKLPSPGSRTISNIHDGTLVTTNYTKNHLIDLKTGKAREFDTITTLPNKFSSYRAEQYVLNRTPSGINLDVINLRNGKRIKSIPLQSSGQMPHLPDIYEVSENELAVNLNTHASETQFINLETGQIEKWDALPYQSIHQVKSQNGAFYLTDGNEFYFPKYRTHVKSDPNLRIESLNTSPDQRHFYYVTRDFRNPNQPPVFHHIDSQTGNHIEIQLGSGIAFSQTIPLPEENSVLMLGQSSGGVIQAIKIDLKTNQFSRTSIGTAFIQSTSVLTYLPSKNAIMIHSDGTSEVKMVSIGKNFKPRVPKNTKAPTTLAEALQKNDLLSFLEQDDWIADFFHSDTFQSKPEWVLPALYSSLARAPSRYQAYQSIYQQYLIKNSIKSTAMNFDLKTYPQSVQDEWRGGFQAYFEELKKIDFDHKTYTFSQLSALEYLSPFLKELDENVSRPFIMSIAHSMSTSAANTFKNVLPDKLLRLIIQNVRPWFGIPSRHISDIEHAINRNQIQLTLLSTDPIDARPNLRSWHRFESFGFYSADVTQSMPQNLPASIQQSWNAGPLYLNAEIKLTPITRTPQDVAPPLAKPDYDSLWKDNELAGVVIVGENLKGDQSWILEEYFEYYKAKGFVFGKKQPISDFHDWLGKEIQSGRLDYMVKEAHTDGDDRNLFRYTNSGSVHVGLKKLPNGKQETITLYEASGGQSLLLSNKEFGTWVRAREKDGVDFVYLNTSCNGIMKVTNEIAAAQTPRLIDLGSGHFMCTFSNHPGSTIYQLIEGLREGKSFEQIRKAVDQVDHTDEGLFVFPDSPEFNQQVRQKLNMFNTEIKIWNADGTPYEIDHSPQRQQQE